MQLLIMVCNPLMMQSNRGLNNMTRYTLKVNVPNFGWALAAKTNDLTVMRKKKARLIKQGHEVQLTMGSK